ncbi:hypothetical protein PIB30_063719 [Stylosanthes scabra]|uniref:Uncharacterized protein n=1 Tax=Stylosanthes scabra TaxID=79078 RepID=A0ABU6UQ70_9FABA|nr:hypothetical protein [Stylosanthes scabra]
MPRRPHVPPAPQEEIMELGGTSQQGQPQPPPQQLHQHQERPILMMPTLGLPQSAPIPHRPKQRIFRPPTTVLNMPTPPVLNPNAISIETMTAAYGRIWLQGCSSMPQTKTRIPLKND